MKISVVIPLYNKEKHIRSTIDCILDQSFQDFEIVVVDDGSLDCGASVVLGYDDARIKLIRQANSGAAAARNRGVAESLYDYVAFMDADDKWDKHYLEKMVNLIRNYPEAVIYGANYYILENGEKTVLQFPGIKDTEGYILDYFESGKVYTPLWTSAVVVKKSVFMQLGGFPTDCKICEDIDLWCRMAAVGKVGYINKPLAIYIRDSSNMLSRATDASCYFPFLDTYKEYFNGSDPRLLQVQSYVTYRQFLAVSYALFTAHNRKEAKRILSQVGIPKGYVFKSAAYRFFSVMPDCMLRLYTTLRRRIG